MLTDVEQNTQTVKISLLPVCIQTTTVDTDASKKGTKIMSSMKFRTPDLSSGSHVIWSVSSHNMMKEHCIPLGLFGIMRRVQLTCTALKEFI